MKRILAAAALAAPLALAPGIAFAGGSTGASNSVSIEQYADFNFNGTQLDVGLQVSCKSPVPGMTGQVTVQVDQSYPETADPLGAHGTSLPTDVVCDGKRRPVGTTIVGVIYDSGQAIAKATLTPTGSTSSVTAMRCIIITVH